MIIIIMQDVFKHQLIIWPSELKHRMKRFEQNVITSHTNVFN